MAAWLNCYNNALRLDAEVWGSNPFKGQYFFRVSFAFKYKTKGNHEIIIITFAVVINSITKQPLKSVKI